MIGNVGVTTRSAVPADFYFPVDMSDIRRYIRYSPVFWAVWNKGVSVPVDRPIQCEIDSPAYSNNVLD